MNTQNATNMDNIFDDCYSLKKQNCISKYDKILNLTYFCLLVTTEECSLKYGNSNLVMNDIVFLMSLLPKFCSEGTHDYHSRNYRIF